VLFRSIKLNIKKRRIDIVQNSDVDVDDLSSLMGEMAIKDKIPTQLPTFGVQPMLEDPFYAKLVEDKEYIHDKSHLKFYIKLTEPYTFDNLHLNKPIEIIAHLRHSPIDIQEHWRIEFAPKPQYKDEVLMGTDDPVKFLEKVLFKFDFKISKPVTSKKEKLNFLEFDAAFRVVKFGLVRATQSPLEFFFTELEYIFILLQSCENANLDMDLVLPIYCLHLMKKEPRFSTRDVSEVMKMLKHTATELEIIRNHCDTRKEDDDVMSSNIKILHQELLKAKSTNVNIKDFCENHVCWGLTKYFNASIKAIK